MHAGTITVLLLCTISGFLKPGPIKFVTNFLIVLISNSNVNVFTLKKTSIMKMCDQYYEDTIYNSHTIACYIDASHICSSRLRQRSYTPSENGNELSSM